MTVPIALVAGEASGDLLGGLLLDGLHGAIPDMAAFGIGGTHMAERGMRIDVPMEKLAVRGYVEVLRHYPELAALRRGLRQRLIASPPSAFIGIDAPDFNFGLERGLRAAGIPTVHFVSPSLWAWRGGRMKTIHSAVDHMLVLFPFEEALYREAGVAATYVGHPLASVIPDEPDQAAARVRLGLAPDDPVLAILPGSRLAEIHYIAPGFVEAAALLKARHPRLQLVVPLATAATETDFRQLLAARRGPSLPVTILRGQSHAVLAACDAALVASGTATLETALFKRPMVIAYRMAWGSWILMKRMGYLPWVGLPNILAREFLVPELLQYRATPAALADAAEVQLFDAANRSRLEERFRAMHQELKRPTGALAGAVVARLIAERR